jgi:hypothetical protein
MIIAIIFCITAGCGVWLMVSLHSKKRDDPLADWSRKNKPHPLPPLLLRGDKNKKII